MAGDDWIEFAKLRTDTDGSMADARATVRVRYELVGGKGGDLRRTLTTYPSDTYTAPKTESSILASDVEDVFFAPDYSSLDETNSLPRYVDIYVDLLSKENKDRRNTSDEYLMTYHARAQIVNRYRYE